MFSLQVFFFFFPKSRTNSCTIPSFNYVQILYQGIQRNGGQERPCRISCLGGFFRKGTGRGSPSVWEEAWHALENDVAPHNPTKLSGCYKFSLLLFLFSSPLLSLSLLSCPLLFPTPQVPPPSLCVSVILPLARYASSIWPPITPQAYSAGIATLTERMAFTLCMCEF